jgi:hypothetical protein
VVEAAPVVARAHEAAPTGAVRAIPRSPDIPHRPFAAGAAPDAASSQPKLRAIPGPMRIPGPAGVPPPRALSASDDDAVFIDRAALGEQAPAASAADREALVAEADRFAIEALRCTEEARAAQVRAERKTVMARLAEEASKIAAEAVRLLETESFAAAAARMEEARRTRDGKGGPSIRPPDATPGRSVLPGPPVAMGGEPSHPAPALNSPPLPVIPAMTVPVAPVFAGAAAAPEPSPPAAPAPLPLPPKAVHAAPPAAAAPSAPAPVAAPPPVAPAPVLRFDPDDLAPPFKSSGLGLGASAGAAAVVVVLVLIVVLALALGK